MLAYEARPGVPSNRNLPAQETPRGEVVGPGAAYIVCFVTSLSGTGVNFFTACFLMIFTAFSTASRRISFGCCALVAAGLPALAYIMSALPSPYNRLATYCAALFPPPTLAEAMWGGPTPPLAARCTVVTGIRAALILLTVATMAPLSVGLMAMTATVF